MVLLASVHISYVLQFSQCCPLQIFIPLNQGSSLGLCFVFSHQVSFKSKTLSSSLTFMVYYLFEKSRPVFYRLSLNLDFSDCFFLDQSQVTHFFFCRKHYLGDTVSFSGNPDISLMGMTGKKLLITYLVKVVSMGFFIIKRLPSLGYELSNLG